MNVTNEQFAPKKEFDEDFEPEEDSEDEDDWTKKVDSKDNIWQETKGSNGGKHNQAKKQSNGRSMEELKKVVKSLSSMLAVCRRQRDALKTPKEAVIKKWVREYITKHHSRVWANFICDENSEKAGRFTEQEILKAIGLKRISTKAYNYMRDNRLCPLPGIGTLMGWIKEHPEWDIPKYERWDIPTKGEFTKMPNESKKTVTDNKSTVNPCGQCGKNFTQKTLLYEHLAEVHGDEKVRTRFQCKVCDKWLSSDKTMTGHRNMHMGIKPFKCTLCDKTYQSKNNMRAHRKEAHAEEWKELRGKLTSQMIKASKPCPICGMHLSTKANLNQHLAEVHSDSKARETQCQTCGKWMMSKLKLKAHMRTHTGERPYSCDFCPQTFMSNTTRWNHLKEKHPVEWNENKDQIKARNRKEGNRKLREAHANRKLGTPGFAPYAPRSTPYNRTVPLSSGEVPILDEATGMVNENAFKCDFCEKAYITQRHMVAHQKESHYDEWLEQKSERRISANATANPCPTCGAVFPVQFALNQHLAEVHNDPAAMELQCKTCNKWLGSKWLLDNHMATHSDEHPYKCDFCPKMFKTYKQMGLHRKNAHQEEWEENKAEIMKRNRVLAIEKRYKNNQLNICG